VISLQINGKPVELSAPTPLMSYLEQLGVNARTVAVEHNGEIIPRTSFTRVTLGDGDRVEIVRMVGGGLGEVPAHIWHSGHRVRVCQERASIRVTQAGDLEGTDTKKVRAFSF